MAMVVCMGITEDKARTRARVLAYLDTNEQASVHGLTYAAPAYPLSYLQRVLLEMIARGEIVAYLDDGSRLLFKRADRE